MSTSNYRSLTSQEITELLNNNNSSDNWDNFFVSGNFNPSLIKNNQFQGKIFLAEVNNTLSTFSNMRLPAGIYNSFLDSVTIGKQVAIHNAKYLCNYSIGDCSLIFNVGDMTCSKKPLFGNGFSGGKNQRNWIEVSNENGGRKILAFEGILEADAFLWSYFRDDQDLQKKLLEYTDDRPLPESKGLIADNCIIKNVKTINDCKIGPFTIIDGANYLNNVTIQSNAEEATFIGSAVELKNGIVGFGNHLTSGSKCSDFISGRNVNIALGARVLNTYIGTNSTIACCEILHNLIFPFHEQHHNNSFLIASTVMGQSNIAAGATIGSNHNSRAADGEILAKRGFWPGLNTSFKHNSVFASFTLVSKASFEMELNISLPFSLVSKDATGKVQIFPAFWFKYNMYALARNNWKFENRDKRRIKDQHIEYDYLAPDTAWEMLHATLVLEEAAHKSINAYDLSTIEDIGNISLKNIVPKQEVLVIKPLQAIWLYKNMILLYAANEITKFLIENDWHRLQEKLKDGLDLQQWLNFGGQLIEEKEALQLIEDIKKGKLKSWNEIHKRYDMLWKHYSESRLKNAVACFLNLEKKDRIYREDIISLLKHAVKINTYMYEWATESREKDYTNPFRKMNYRNKEEMTAVVGDIMDNTFLKAMKISTERFSRQVKSILIKLEKGCE